MRGVWAIPGINPPAKVCNKGQRERVAVKANRRTNKGETCHEGWEGVLVSDVEAFRELTSIGGIGEELLHSKGQMGATILRQGQMGATIMKPACAR